MISLSPDRRLDGPSRGRWGLLISTLVLLSGVVMAGPKPVRSDHFDGKRFFNPHDATNHGAGEALKWAANRKPSPWRRVAVQPAPPPAPRVDGDDLRVTWVGHSTLLVQWAGLNLLTDPVWSERVSPVSWAGPARFAAPGLRFEDLPPIDAVVISHNHYDHLDEASVIRLHREHDPRFFVPLGVKPWMEKRGITRVDELDWWGSVEALGARFHAVPVQHFSGRGATDRNATLWVGWVVEAASGRFFFAGDTGYSPDFVEIGRRFAPIRLAAIPIGAYDPRWFMAPVHVDPAQAAQIHVDVGAQQSVAIHFGTFKLTDEPQDEPPRLLAEACGRLGIPPGAFAVLGHGGSLDVSGQAVLREAAP